MKRKLALFGTFIGYGVSVYAAYKIGCENAQKKNNRKIGK